MEKIEMRLAGSGGQGVILATIILAEAALLSGKMSAQSQSYGPEARGGMCKAEVIVSDKSIWYTKVKKPTLLLALTQESLDKYSVDLAPNCIVIADESLTVNPELKEEFRVLSIPILKSAKEKTGKAFTANIIAVSVINEVLSLVSREELLEAVMLHVPKGTEEINIKALKAGEEIAQIALGN